MKIFVTGSKGVIGSALTQMLEKLGMQVVGLDVKEDVNHLNYGDIIDKKSLTAKMNGCDGVIHLAAVSRVILGEENPILCWETNVTGTSNIVRAALEAESKPWIIHISSREIYGQQEKFPVKETSPTNPLNIYGRSKIASERIVIGARRRGLLTAVLRLSDVYGCLNDHTDNIIPAYCLSAMNGQSINVEGKNRLLDFIHIDDVLKGILSTVSLLSKSRLEIPPIHLTTGIPVSLHEVAYLVNQAFGNRSSIVEVPHKFYDVAQFYGDPALAQKLLGWRPVVNFKEGIGRLIDHYRLNSDHSRSIEFCENSEKTCDDFDEAFA